ncbi:hypothetical protein REPUB_Repub09cG0169900 [Reevesia pubescens]
MTSHFRKEEERLMFTPKAPQFFKIILENTLQDGKLGIPIKFVKKYGNAMSNQALLKVPSGKIWLVELSKCDGQIWFQKGWREFAEYYSLCRGHFLVFRYEGNCDFHVLIFDMSASEIDYPYTKADSVSDGNSQDFNVQEAEDDVSVEIIEETGPCNKKREKSPIQCPRPQKMMKTNLTNKTEKILNSEYLGPRFKPYGNKASGTKLEKLEGNTNSSCFKQEDGVLEATCRFASNVQFFRRVVHPSYLTHGHVDVPFEFVKKHFKPETEYLALQVSDRFWSVRTLIYPRYRIAKLAAGWCKFARENSLKVGDVCVFELITSSDAKLNVSIFRSDG